MTRILLIAAAILLMCSPARAGWLSNTVKGALQSAGERGTNEAVSGAYEAAKGGARKAVEGGEGDRQDPQEEAGEGQARSAASAGRPAVEETSQDPATAPAGRATPAAARGIDQGARVAEPGSLPNEKAFRNFDFIPGERVFFFDDFSDTDVGEFPRRWTLKGPAGGGTPVEVVELGGRRFLSVRAPGADEMVGWSQLYLRLAGKDDLPEKFTVEFDALLHPYERGGYEPTYAVHFLTEDGYPRSHGDEGSVAFTGHWAASANTKSSVEYGDGKLHRISISVNGTFVKVYVDGDRVINDPDAIGRPIARVGYGAGGGYGTQPTLMTNLRIAEGGKDIKGALETDGRIVAHGIHFDTGSDTIRSESYSSLKRILDLLNADPGLRFRVEGHTDSIGGPGVNQPLSEKRAAAVRAWLVGKGVAAERLTTEGLGDTKPLDRNDTPEGRANNRRVEFVKL